MLHILLGAILSGSLVFVAMTIGFGALERLRVATQPALPMTVVAVATGIGMLGMAYAGSTAVFGFGRVPVLSVTAVLILASLRWVSIAIETAGWAAREVLQLLGKPLTVVLLALAFGVLFVAGQPPGDYDSLMYHLQVPWQLIAHGTWHLPPGNPHISYVGFLHILYVPFLHAGVAEAAAGLNAWLFLCLGLAAAGVGSELGGRTAGQLSWALTWASPVLVLTAVTPKVDVSAAFFLFAAVLALLLARKPGGSVHELIVLSGCLGGFAIGIKFLSLPFSLALLLVVALISIRHSAPRPRVIGLEVSWFAIAAILTAGPFIIKNQLLFGAPFYPHFAEAAPPGWLALAREADWVPSLGGQKDQEPLHTVREPFSLRAWFLAPETLTPELQGGAYYGNPLFLLLPLVAGARHRWRGGFIVLPGAVFLLVVLVHGQYVNLRYLVPAIPTFTVGAALVLADLFFRPAAPRVWRSAGYLLVTIVSLYGVASTLTALPTRQMAAYATGMQGRSEFELHHPEMAAFARLRDHLNVVIPQDAHVLFLFEGRGLGVNAVVLQDNVLTNWRWLSEASEQEGCLSGGRITHVVVASGTLGYFLRRGLDARSVRLAELGVFVGRCLRRHSHVAGYEIFEVVNTEIPAKPPQAHRTVNP